MRYSGSVWSGNRLFVVAAAAAAAVVAVVVDRLDSISYPGQHNSADGVSNLLT